MNPKPETRLTSLERGFACALYLLGGYFLVAGIVNSIAEGFEWRDALLIGVAWILLARNVQLEWSIRS